MILSLFARDGLAEAGGRLSASRFAGMTAATAQSKYLLHVVSEEKPYLPRKGHLDMKVREERADAWSTMAVAMVLFLFTMHAHTSLLGTPYSVSLLSLQEPRSLQGV